MYGFVYSQVLELRNDNHCSNLYGGFRSLCQKVCVQYTLLVLVGVLWLDLAVSITQCEVSRQVNIKPLRSFALVDGRIEARGSPTLLNNTDLSAELWQTIAKFCVHIHELRTVYNVTEDLCSLQSVCRTSLNCAANIWSSLAQLCQKD